MLEKLLHEANHLGWEIHNLYQDGSQWKCRLKNYNRPLYAYGEHSNPCDAIRLAMADGVSRLFPLAGPRPAPKSHARRTTTDELLEGLDL